MPQNLSGLPNLFGSIMSCPGGSHAAGRRADTINQRAVSLVVRADRGGRRLHRDRPAARTYDAATKLALRSSVIGCRKGVKRDFRVVRMGFRYWL